jgi:hypothetical protein
LGIGSRSPKALPEIAGSRFLLHRLSPFEISWPNAPKLRALSVIPRRENGEESHAAGDSSLRSE